MTSFVFLTSNKPRSLTSLPGWNAKLHEPIQSFIEPTPLKILGRGGREAFFF